MSKSSINGTSVAGGYAGNGGFPAQAARVRVGGQVDLAPAGAYGDRSNPGIEIGY